MGDLDETLILIDIFRFTVRENEAASIRSDSSKAVKVSCLDLSQKLLDKKVLEKKDTKPWDKLQEILFERLLLEDYASCHQVTLSHESLTPDPEFNPSDSQILRYLYACYFRLQKLLKQNRTASIFSRVERLILDQVVLYLSLPEPFPDRDKRCKNNQQAPVLLNLISHYITKQEHEIQKFVNSIGELCGESEIDTIMGPTYLRLSQKFVKLAIDDPSIVELFSISRAFLVQPNIARKFMDQNVLKKDNSIAYQSTLLGFMLAISPLPRATQPETTFFKNPIRSGESDHRFTENQLGIKMKILGEELHKVFHSLLKLPETRNSFLSWLGRCLHTFKDRKKLWSNQILMSTTTISVNDGFLMNFLTVMLHLSEPFVGPYNTQTINLRMLRVDPRYCKWSKSDHQDCPVHFLGLSEETFLVNSVVKSNNETEDNNVQPNFISECFYGAHQTFTYSFRSIYERFFKLAQNINELQSAHALSIASGHEVELINQKIDSAMSQFLNFKAVLVESNRVMMQLHFCVATASYLNHLVACESYEEALAAKTFKTITLDTLRGKKTSKACLSYIPEMLVENILDFFIFLKHFNEQALTRATGMLEPIMTLIITFMGNSSLMQNPHLRARFAEILECLMPHQSHLSSFNGCAILFESHPLIDELAPSLVNVFVSIEMTGEGVQFEQKFSYRRPMYVVLEYLWDRPLHQRKLIQLANAAEANIESARPPLFLRFINLLMNDAIFLLDEALNYMNQLKEAEQRRRTPEWQSLTPQQRAQAEASYSHIGRLARFHNVLSLSTIGTLAWLTSKIKTIFCHPTLVDRIANMLNYFLQHLVGPKKGKFNVNDKNDYEFKPREVLEKICTIYIHLGQEESNRKFNEFCTAVSSDGRSYTENLLPQARDILFRTGMNSLGSEFEKLAGLIHRISVQNQLDEIQTEDIPDTFLDPIMSTLMVDPVLLPSSKIIVDRSTIARHLLSDQTDPFNRSPLSMEDVIPDIDLKDQIQCFLKERRLKRSREEINSKGWADAVSKILRMGKVNPSSNRILSKASSTSEAELISTGGIDSISTGRIKSSNPIVGTKRLKPDPQLDALKVNELKNDATRGVVHLFNAIKTVNPKSDKKRKKNKMKKRVGSRKNK